MDIILGIDVGGSNTKVVALDKSAALQFSFLIDNNYGDIKAEIVRRIREKDCRILKIALTGIGSHKIGDKLLGVPTVAVDEFTAIGLGGLQLSGLDEAVVASMGTGTAFVHAKGDRFEHIIGTGVGGGTLLGLCGKLIGANDIKSIESLSKGGNLSRVDLTIGEISGETSLPSNLTASNFAGVKPDACDSDFVLGTMNLVLQVVGTMSILSCMSVGTRNIVLTGAMTRASLAESAYKLFSETYGYNFVIPPHATFATAVGAALKVMTMVEKVG